MGRGITIKHIYGDQLKYLAIPLPPLPEQAAIVRFLDHADRRIQRYICAQQKLIALLEEQKQVIVNQAVTGQIDVRTGQPYPAYKDSGVEWLGEVPEHWGVVRLKQVAVVQSGITLGKNYGSKALIEQPYLRVANVQAGRLDLSRVATVRVPAAETARSTLEYGDVLMTEGGDIDKLGRGCIWHGEIPDCLHQNHIFAVRPNREVLLPEFLVILMGSAHGRNYFQVTAKQTTNLAATNSSTLGDFRIHVPGVVEQQVILNDITEKCGGHDAAIDCTRRQIPLLHEYRTRLIADVVTGKLDVRNVDGSAPMEDPALDQNNDFEEETEPNEADVMEEGYGDD